MACKFENRIDYIDISAYGIGKVKLDADGNIVKQHNTEERKKEKEQNMESEQDLDMDVGVTESRVFKRIHDLDKRVKNIKYSICSMAQR